MPVILSILRKPGGNLRGQFPEVSGQSFIDGPHGRFLPCSKLFPLFISCFPSSLSINSISKKSQILGLCPQTWTTFSQHSPNVSTTPITATGCRQCLPFQLKGKHCRKLHCRNGVVDTFKPCLTQIRHWHS